MALGDHQNQPSWKWHHKKIHNYIKGWKYLLRVLFTPSLHIMQINTKNNAFLDVLTSWYTMLLLLLLQLLLILTMPPKWDKVSDDKKDDRNMVILKSIIWMSHGESEKESRGWW